VTINLVNRCQSEIYVSIDDIWDGIIGQNKSIPIECEPSDGVKMSVHVNHRKPCRGNIHNLNLITHYTFENVKNDAEFIITREKIRVALYVSYERLFVNTADATKISEKALVNEPDQNDKRYKRSRIKDTLLGPFEDLTELCFILFVSGLLLGWLVSWYLLLIYYPLTYLVLLGIDWVVKTAVNESFKRRFNADESNEFYQFCDPDYIAYYYSQSDRKPFLGKVDTK